MDNIELADNVTSDYGGSELLSVAGGDLLDNNDTKPHVTMKVDLDISDTLVGQLKGFLWKQTS